MTEQKEEMQQKFVLYQLLQSRAEELKKQIELLGSKNTEIETTKYALEELSKAKKDNDILIPLGSGIYTSGKLSFEILTDIGAGVMTIKDFESAKLMVEEKGTELEKIAATLQEEILHIVTKMNELVPELQKAIEEQKTE